MGEKLKVVIDPGHGRGARPQYPDGTCETDVAWDTAIKLRELLDQQGHTVVLTKESRDELLAISKRGQRSAKEKADVFVSLHCNAAPNNPRKRGVYGIFYGKHVRENKAPDAEIKAPKGRRLARFIAQEISELTGIPLLGYDGAKLWWRCPANLGVLTSGRNWAVTDAACLIEAGFLTNDKDRKIMGSEQGQLLYAKGCARGIYRYAGLEIPSEWGLSESEDDGSDLEPGEEPIGDAAEERSASLQWAKSMGLSNLDDLDQPVTRGELLVTLHKILER